MDDLGAMFDEVVTSGEAEGGDAVFEELSRNATIHTGDEDESEVSDETSDETDESEDSDENEQDETDEETDEDESETDESDESQDDFDFDSNKEKLVTIKLNGETTKVPLGELRNGYMRQADYTRKTQQIAADMPVVAWAKEMQAAFANDPAGTISALQDYFGLVPENESPDEFDNLDPEIQPLAKAIKGQQAEIARLRREAEQARASEAEARLNADVRAELDHMKSTYDDFDPQVVLPLAISEKITMAQAYKLWKADQITSKATVSATAKAKADKAATTREAAKKATKQVTKGGSNRKVAASDKWKTFDSFEDLFNHEIENTR
jgi:hypothetical protein